MLCVALVLMVQIDRLIHGTLYDFGLVFNEAWAQPYWLMFRVSLVLIVAAIILISVVELPYPAFEEKTEQEKTKETVREVETESQVVEGEEVKTVSV